MQFHTISLIAQNTCRVFIQEIQRTANDRKGPRSNRFARQEESTNGIVIEMQNVQNNYYEQNTEPHYARIDCVSLMREIKLSKYQHFTVDVLNSMFLQILLVHLAKALYNA